MSLEHLLAILYFVELSYEVLFFNNFLCDKKKRFIAPNELSLTKEISLLKHSKQSLTSYSKTCLYLISDYISNMIITPKENMGNKKELFNYKQNWLLQYRHNKKV